VDTDGDGLCDVEEVLAGTDPSQAASVLRITGIAREGGDIRVSWQAGGDRTDMLSTSRLRGAFTLFHRLNEAQMISFSFRAKT
jgi:hypothetical protein